MADRRRLFSRVREGMHEVQRIAGFDSRELSRFAALIAEARAATLSYLLETIADLEFKQAGRLFSARRALERRESPS